MNNYNYYEKEIIEILGSGDCVAVSNDTPASCRGIECEKCDFSAGCYEELAEWLAKEHTGTERGNERTDGAVKFCTWLVKHYGFKSWIFKVEKALCEYLKEK